MDFESRADLGHHVEDCFDQYVNLFTGYESFDIRYLKNSLDRSYLQKMEHIEEFIEEDAFMASTLKVCGKESSVQYFNWLSERNKKIPSYKRYCADRLVKKYGLNIFQAEIKTKSKSSHRYWTVEFMDVASAFYHEADYGCKVFFVFPPEAPEQKLYGHYSYWTFCTVEEVLAEWSFFKPPQHWKGSRIPCYRILCDKVQKPLSSFLNPSQHGKSI